ncbi:MAG: winged helix-turn-helix domain-containing protein [Candidatus Bathyarchaeia archaeon]
MEDDDWKLLSVLDSKVRMAIVGLLLKFEFASLSEIARKLEDCGSKMTISGVLKHVKELESAGLVRHESGVFADKPDARRTLYFVEGKERVEKMLRELEACVLMPLRAGMLFNKTASLARELQRLGHKPSEKDRAFLESLLSECESQDVCRYLTEDEKKKLKFWRMMMAVI